MEQGYTIRNVADIKKIETTPVSELVIEKNTYELIRKGAEINPDATAISFLLNGDGYNKPLEISYKEFMGKIRQTANMLHDLGVGPDDVVTYLLPALPQTHYILWGAEAVGIANPINPLLEPETIRDICIAAGTKVLVGLGDFPGSDIWKKVDAIRGQIPTLTSVIRVFGPSDEAEGIYGYDEKVETYPGDQLIFERNIDPDDIASLYHTGGTTGRPKLARRSHFNEVFLMWDLKTVTNFQPGETVMVGLPLFHCNGTCITGLLPFSVGGHVVILSPTGFRDVSILKNFYKIVDHFKPSFFSCVPTVLSGLIEIPVEDSDISSLKYLICGAAPLSVELFNRFEEHTGMKILEGYGLTESTCACAVNPKDGERKIGSIGFPLPYQKMKVVVTDDDGNFLRDAETGEIGSVCISGPCVFKGYVEEEHNRGIWVQDGWFNSGDLGRQDEDGFFFLTGRKKELIIRGGHNIDPAMIEEPLYRMKEVKMVAAIGRPDAHAGEVPVAYVEVAENSKISSEDIMEWAKKNIGERAAIPKEIIVIEQIPLTAVGKVFKPALKWDATRRVYEKELAGLEGLADSFSVKVNEDKVYGTCAKITIKPAKGVDKKTISQKVSELLTKYTIHYDVDIV
ncbi:FadD5 [Desulforapulum autotrophicum HRM2]|uniref:FadD5 n=1 Tax=Desulforapulum autotrophicum (strain ATCC 43914 / DSM 3382 / VKM B-1955 / HRM2) TaxID=177437 RepID=C0QDE3_DESAH|nr:acyl-CoA synthetase [Desulforapulum autotrophicum]ACN15207.1 FadD5 [Desulforapulum autotrophicum HRM2]